MNDKIEKKIEFLVSIVDFIQDDGRSRAIIKKNFKKFDRAIYDLLDFVPNQR